MKKSKNDRDKAYFLQRCIAFFIDIILVSAITSVITYPFVNNKNIEKLSEQSNLVMQNYVDKKIDATTYLNQSIDISYDQAKITGFSNIISILILVLYFIVFQIYRSGQTLGKKIMRIQLVKDDGSNLTMDNMIIRELINNFILANILISIITLFGKNAYFYGSSIIDVIQYIVLIVTIFMILFRKDGKGLSDIIVGTKVISLNSEVEEK